MKLLVLAGAYPHAGHIFSGVFNEKCVRALSQHCDHVEVLAPRPFAPAFLRFHPRWSAYRQIPKVEERNGVFVFRPAIPVAPGIGSSLWVDSSAFAFLHRFVRRRHHQTAFDAIMSFDLVETGGIAWRLANVLKIPASGWGFGEDLRYPLSSPFTGVVRRAIKNLDYVFYQSHELMLKGKQLLDKEMTLDIERRQRVLPHGIPLPPKLDRSSIRERIRSELGIDRDAVLAVNISRVTRMKGVFDLIDAFELAVQDNPLLHCLWLGEKAGFDDSLQVRRRVQGDPILDGKFKLLPSCEPEKVWEYLCAADIFICPSHREGISNSVLEAMSMSVPVVAFAIPSNLEIDSGKNVLKLVPPYNVSALSGALLQLSRSPEDRAALGRHCEDIVNSRFRIDKNMKLALDLVQAGSLIGQQPS